VVLLAAVLAPYLFELFTDDAKIIRVASLLIRAGLVLELGRCFNLIVIKALRASGDARFPVLAGMVSPWGIMAFGGWLTRNRLVGRFFGTPSPLHAADSEFLVPSCRQASPDPVVATGIHHRQLALCWECPNLHSLDRRQWLLDASPLELPPPASNAP
jgi:hypothetical protein